MKATTKICNVRTTELGLKPDQFRIGKHGNKEGTTMSDTEMVACFAKLKDLVPTIPADRKISKVNLLQHVIDYILDLELTLEHHPSMSKTPPPQLLAAAGLPERRPLGESTTFNTLLQVSSHLERSEAEKCTTRPASY